MMAGLDLTVDQIGEAVQGSVSGDRATTVAGVTIDSRQGCAGALFVAISGDRFDGHDFVAAAVANGARAALVHKPVAGATVPCVRVDDTLAALQALGRRMRSSFEGVVVGITGSSGKTTTRRMVTAIVSQTLPTLSPIKNFNNHIGVPLTLLRLRPEHRAAVLELGCSDFGEIAGLTAVARPDVGLVTNVGAAHLEKLGSLDGVAAAKGELFLGMAEETTAVVNRDDPRVFAMPLRSKRRILYGRHDEADVRLLDQEGQGLEGQTLELSLFGERLQVRLPLLGAHNGLNALAAAAAAAALGVPARQVCSGLAAVTPEPGRLTVMPAGGFTVIDDTYNANPNAMRAAVAALAEAGRGRLTVAVLGDMRELGAGAEARHHEIGSHVVASGIDRLVTLGPLGDLIGRGAVAAGMPSSHWARAADHGDAARKALDMIEGGAVVLVKGSRGMTMEKVVAPLLEG